MSQTIIFRRVIAIVNSQKQELYEQV